MAFIYMVIKYYFFICFLAVHRAEARTFFFLNIPVYKFGKYLPFILLLEISFSYHLLKRFSLYNNCFHHLYHHKVKIAYRHRFSCTCYLFHTHLFMKWFEYVYPQQLMIQKYPAALKI